MLIFPEHSITGSIGSSSCSYSITKIDKALNLVGNADTENFMKVVLQKMEHMIFFFPLKIWWSLRKGISHWAEAYSILL